MRYRLWCARMEIKNIRILWLVVALDISTTHTDHIITEKCLRLIINHRRRPRLMWNTHFERIWGEFTSKWYVSDEWQPSTCAVHETWGSSYNAGLQQMCQCYVSKLKCTLKPSKLFSHQLFHFTWYAEGIFGLFFFLLLLMFKISFGWCVRAGRGFFWIFLNYNY